VGREVVADDDVIALERWHETLFDIRQEGLSGHGVIKHAWRGHPLRRRPATKVIVCRAGNGRLAAPFVLAAVPSITSRVVSRVPCSRIQRRRARATSARFCSAARRLFFEGDLMTLEEALYRAAAAGNPSLVHRRDHLIQRQVRLVHNQREQTVRVLPQRRRTRRRAASRRNSSCRERTLPI
jgi:hypothetical protein